MNENKIGQDSVRLRCFRWLPCDIRYVRVIPNDRVLNGICDIMLLTLPCKD
ncbi:MAG: hypothetical protein ACLUDU_05860 [Butyricimonas faecihominis]